MTATETDVAWAAGLLEGEGSFLAKPGTCSPTAVCHMTDLDVLERLQGIFGGPIYVVTNRQAHWKPSWKWQVVGHLAADVMRQVRPYMMLRRGEVIDGLLRVWDARQEELADHSSNIALAMEYYRAMPKKSLRKAGDKFGVNYATLRRHLTA